MHHFVQRLPGNTNANYRKELEGGKWKSLGNDFPFITLKVSQSNMSLLNMSQVLLNCLVFYKGSIFVIRAPHPTLYYFVQQMFSRPVHLQSTKTHLPRTSAQTR